MILTIQNVSKHFGGVKAVNKCSFKIKEGQITALIGPNGAGKTTLFDIISGFLQSDSGAIYCCGKNEITNLKPHQIANLGVGRTFQQTRLFNNLTIQENLLLAIDNENTKFWKNLFLLNRVTKEKIKKVHETLKLVNLHEHTNKKCLNLSYGQQKLVEIARILIKSHKLILLDEPVAGVNPKIRQDIKYLLRELKKQNQTILLIEHDMNFVMDIADHIIVMDEGKVIAQGNPKQIQKNKKVLEAYLGA
ncbi:MAG: ABC transporter ATP-binding protein [Candidatus Woesearchaeota archaeon]